MSLPEGWEWVGGKEEWYSCTLNEGTYPPPVLRFAYVRHQIPTALEPYRHWYVRVMESVGVDDAIAGAVLRYASTWACLAKGHTPELVPSDTPYCDDPQSYAPCEVCRG